MKVSDVYCYYEEIGDPDGVALLALWQRVWAGHGWTPHVLRRTDAEQHPLFQHTLHKASALPTVNGRDFETACYVRWCAFATIPGQGAATDYDVFPRTTYPPREYEGFYSGDRCSGPGWLVGSASDFNQVLNAILAYHPLSDDQFQGEPHVSDMIVLQRNPQLFTSRNHDVTCYGLPDWQELPLVHFGGAYTPKPRSKFIREVLHV